MDDDPQPPDLQDWIRRYGGYQNIDWAAWDRAVSEWRQQYRELMQRELVQTGRSPATRRPASKKKRAAT